MRESFKMTLVQEKDINHKTRRELLRQIAGMGIYLPMAKWISPLIATSKEQPHTHPAPPPTPTVLSPDDDQFLEDMEKENFLYFWEQANPLTGLVKDRCNMRAPNDGIVASIAATGFGLTALCIGEKRGYISFTEAQN